MKSKSQNSLFILLVGIEKYVTSPLFQTVGDVNKVEKYFKGLKKHFKKVETVRCIDEKATKDNIVSLIKSTLAKAKKGDKFVFYYSGHGAYENTGNRFKEDHNDLLECLVCYDGSGDNYLLSDKELRYLFSKSNPQAEIVTIFDCCHSGGMSRGISSKLRLLSKKTKSIKRLSKIFKPRPFRQFIFSRGLKENTFKRKSFTSAYEVRNQIHLAACLSRESSWEDSSGGIFTRYLLEILNQNSNKISYQEIAKFTKIAIKEMTEEVQSPQVIPSDFNNFDVYDSWLNLYASGTSSNQGSLVFNNGSWFYSNGKLLGVNKGDELKVIAEKKTTIVVKIAKVNFEDSLVKIPNKYLSKLDSDKIYPVVQSYSFRKLKVNINNVDFDAKIESSLISLLKENKLIELGLESTSDFSLNIFNQQIYFSLPGDYLRPLHKQIDLFQNEKKYLNEIKNVSSSIVKWNHYNNFNNPGKGFTSAPISVKAKMTSRYVNILDRTLKIKPKRQARFDGLYYNQGKIKVTNISNQNIFVTALILTSDMGITATPFANESVELKPKESKLFYASDSSDLTTFTLDKHHEIYNWEYEWYNLKFIVSNTDDLTNSIRDIRQLGLSKPIVKKLRTRGRGIKSLAKSIGGGSFDSDDSPTWAVYDSKIHLTNPNYNVISGFLETDFQWYSKNELLAPFISGLYFNSVQIGYESKLEIKRSPSKRIVSSKGIKLFIGNTIDNFRRKRIFKRARKLNPNNEIVVAEGDSWFLYPIYVKDTIDYIIESHPVLSLAAAGATLQSYKKSGKLIKEVKKYSAAYALLSGGGNDIIGPEIEDLLIENAKNPTKPRDYLNDKFESRISELEKIYKYFFDRLSNVSHVKKIIIHGYAYVRSDQPKTVINDGWVNKYMIAAGIKKAKDREVLIIYLVDAFNTMLKDLSKKYQKVKYLDVRNSIAKDEWYDEIHPSDEGYKKVAAKFLKQLK